MPVGIDMQLGAATETTYDTRVVPNRFFIVMSEGIAFERAKYVSRGLSANPWRRREITTTQGGSGDISMEVPTVGFGFWLNLLHPNSATPVQVGGTTAYLQTHTLSASPTKSATIQIGVPKRDSGIQAVDYTGCMVGGINLAWESAGVLTTTIPVTARSEDTAQTLATNAPPATWDLFSFKHGELRIAATPVADITGGGNLSVSWPMRTDAFEFGQTGKMMKPLPTDLPTASGEFEVDFVDLTHYNRVINDTIADVVLEFEHHTAIAASNFPKLTVTIPDCSFTGTRPTVAGPGVLSQTVGFRNSSATGDAVVITYQSIDTAI